MTVLTIPLFLEIAHRALLVRCHQEGGFTYPGVGKVTIEAYMMGGGQLFQLRYRGAFPEYDVMPLEGEDPLSVNLLTRTTDSEEVVRQILGRWAISNQDWMSTEEVITTRADDHVPARRTPPAELSLMEYYAAIQAILREQWIQKAHPGLQVGYTAAILGRFFNQWNSFRKRQRLPWAQIAVM